MRIFLTGATGFIGSAVARELQAAGHHVTGLARTDEAVARLAAAGVYAHQGDLSDPHGLAVAAAAHDGVIHTAFMRAPSGYASSEASTAFTDFAGADLEAIRAMGDALAGSGRPLVVTSGTLGVASDRPALETDAGDPRSPAGARAASEEATLSLAARGVRSSVVRLPPVVHGAGDRGFLPALIAVARRTGVSPYVGEGLNRWPAVHLLDAAPVFRLALERGAAGSRHHAVGEPGIAFRDIAEAIASGLGATAVSRTPAEVGADYGRLAHLMSVDAPASGDLTRARLGWRPLQAGVLSDLASGHYFQA